MKLLNILFRKPRVLFPCPDCGQGFLLASSARLCEFTHDIQKTLEAE